MAVQQLYSSPNAKIEAPIFLCIFISKNPLSSFKYCIYSWLYTLLYLNFLDMWKLSKNIEDVVFLKLEYGFNTCVVAKELGLS